MVCFFKQTVAQTNLVPNPSFEDYLVCPSQAGVVNLIVPGWGLSFSTADYYHQCGSYPVGVPFNSSGYQYPKSGQAYVGFYLYFKPYNFSEFIQTRLLKSLKKDKTYCVSFWINLSDSSKYAVHNIGVLLTSDSIPAFNAPLIKNYNASVENSREENPLNDKENWKLLEFNYTAQGDEKYMIISNFKDTSDTDLEYVGSLNEIADFAYYYIDDVSVILCETQSDTAYVLVPNVFTPNEDGINDVILIETKGVKHLQVSIYNRWGMEINTRTYGEDFWEAQNDTGNTTVSIWDGQTNEGYKVSNGTYFYVVTYTTYNDEVATTKGSLSLLR
ncbi:MAG: hypothetical protein Kow0079_03510 [Vicingaceae bacterium]